MLSHLLLMRHAKSSWSHADLNDHARPLNSRGRQAADNIARALMSENYDPDIIWSSDSQRTKETALRLIQILPGAQSVFYQPSFYLSGAIKTLDILSTSDEPDGKLMLLGHNPGWEGLFEYFSGHYERFPTGACAVFSRKDKLANWLTPKAWAFETLLRPRDLSAA